MSSDISLPGCTLWGSHRLGQPCPAPLLISEVLEEPSLSSLGVQVWPAQALGILHALALSRDGTNFKYPFFPSKAKDQSQNLDICSHCRRLEGSSPEGWQECASSTKSQPHQAEVLFLHTQYFSCAC